MSQDVSGWTGGGGDSGRREDTLGRDRAAGGRRQRGGAQARMKCILIVEEVIELLTSGKSF